MNALKNILILISICVITTALSWLLVFNLLGLFIDRVPYNVGNDFYISEILLTFTVYSTAGLLSIKYTKLHPLVASLPVGMTGLIFYAIDWGGFSCIGDCSMPFWYHQISFFKHFVASAFIGILFLIKQHSNTGSARSTDVFKNVNWFSKLSVMRSAVIGFSLLTVSLLIWGIILFTDISANAKDVSLYSEVLEEQRNVTVFIPSGYSESDKSYDVLYTLDGEKPQHNYLAAGTAKMLANLGIIPEIIVVAIDGQGMRRRDFRLKGEVDVNGQDSSGEAGRFQMFLEDELIPSITRNFRTGERKFIAGHSYGGLFAAYSFSKHRDSFDGYFCFSPSFHKSASSAAWFTEGLGDQLIEDKFIYQNLGLEGGAIRELFKKVETTLYDKSAKNSQIKISYYSLPHSLIMVPGYFDALTEFYLYLDSTHNI